MCQDKKIWKKFVKNVMPINIGLTRTYIIKNTELFTIYFQKQIKNGNK